MVVTIFKGCLIAGGIFLLIIILVFWTPAIINYFKKNFTDKTENLDGIATITIPSSFEIYKGSPTPNYTTVQDRVSKRPDLYNPHRVDFVLQEDAYSEGFSGAQYVGERLIVSFYNETLSIILPKEYVNDLFRSNNILSSLLDYTSPSFTLRNDTVRPIKLNDITFSESKLSDTASVQYFEKVPFKQKKSFSSKDRLIQGIIITDEERGIQMFYHSDAELPQEKFQEKALKIWNSLEINQEEIDKYFELLKNVSSDE